MSYAVAAPNGRAMTETQTSRYMTFTVGRQTYAVQRECVLDMLGRRAATIHPLPNGPRAIPRVARWSPRTRTGESQPLPLIDLARYLRVLEDLRSPRPIILVVTDGAHTMGIMVDTIDGVVSIPAKAVGPVPALHEQIESAWIAGVVMRAEGVLTMLDVDAILTGAASTLAATGPLTGRS